MKIREIQTLVCWEYGVKLDDLLSARRTAKIVHARQVAMTLCRREGISTPKIGYYFKRDHTTVVHACDKITAQYSLAPVPRHG
jgi:chromosomal replication initiator protein